MWIKPRLVQAASTLTTEPPSLSWAASALTIEPPSLSWAASTLTTEPPSLSWAASTLTTEPPSLSSCQCPDHWTTSLTGQTLTWESGPRDYWTTIHLMSYQLTFGYRANMLVCCARLLLVIIFKLLALRRMPWPLTEYTIQEARQRNRKWFAVCG